MNALYQRVSRPVRKGLSPKGVELIEAPCHLTRQFHVRDLVLAYRNKQLALGFWQVGRGAVNQNVGRLQQWISEKTIGAEVLVLEVLALLLVAGHPLQPSQRSDHAEQQVQLGVLQHVRLDEQRAALGIEAGREVVDHDLKRVLLDAARVGVVGGESVPIGNEEKAVILVLQAYPVAQRADIIAEVQLSGRSHAAEYAALFGWQRHQSPNRNPLKKCKTGYMKAPSTPPPKNMRITNPHMPMLSYTRNAPCERKCRMTWLPSSGGIGMRLKTPSRTLITMAAYNSAPMGTMAPASVGMI